MAPTSSNDNGATLRAMLKQEYKWIREAYILQPDSAGDADDWSNAEEWKP